MAPDGGGYANLDGTWTHDNGSDAWDGSEIGGFLDNTTNRPGGISLGTQNSVEYLRMQDPGDPRDYPTYTDPSNRKVYLGHNIGSDIDPTKALTIMDTGVTLTFRGRIPTLAKAGGPLDVLHRDGQQANGIQSYPTNGDGYVTSDGGKGNFVVRQGGNGTDVAAGAIAFSFTQTTDTTGGDPNAGKAGFAGLTFNEFNGNVPTANVNFGQGSKTNVVAFDPTEWHELYVVIRKDPANIGTHEAFIFRDDGLLPIVFKMTAGTGSDMPDSFLAMGGSATGQNYALDVDWFGYKDEAVFPPGALLPPSLFGFAPVNRQMFHPTASNFSFSASALMPTNRLPAAGFKVTLNGQDVSSQLTLTGSDTSASRTATFSALQANTIYTSTIIVTDSGGLSTTNDVSFDTFVAAAATLIEAEDYNFGNGQFLDNPAPGAYTDQVGTPGVDFFDTTPTTLGIYRTSDAVDIAATADFARANFVNAAVTDNQIGTVSRTEWWNYTRTLAATQYQAWIRVASTAAQAVRLDRVTSNPDQANQSVQFLGLFQVPSTGSLNIFSHVQLTDAQGRPIVLSLSGTNTLRLTAVGANDDIAVNFLMLLTVAGNVAGEPLLSVLPAPSAVGVLPDTAVEAVIYDGSNAVSQGSVKLRVGGTEVIASVVKAGTITTLKYIPTTLWAPGATNNLSLAYNDGTDRTFNWSFTTVNYPVLTPAMKVTNATLPGFVWRVHQNEANVDASLQKADGVIAGTFLGSNGQPLANLADSAASGAASGPGAPASPGTGMMSFNIPTVINLGQDTASDTGNFIPDEQMPGVPGSSLGADGIAVEINTFIQLPSGLVTMGVNSDDGFRTRAGFLNNTPLTLATVDGGRSATDTLFQFAVQAAGVYAFRTVYYEGNGGASIEWFQVKSDGTKVLVNDAANGGFTAYQQGTIPAAPASDVVITAKVNGSGQVVIEWSSGTLLSADAVNGNYLPVAGATSPYPVNPSTAPSKFFRVQVQ